MRILVADDDALVRRALVAMLRSRGHETLEAANGAEAIAVYREHMPDVLLCDLFMPEHDGLEVIQAVRKLHPEARTIAMSGGGFGRALDAMPAAHLLGATKTLTKPFTRELLLETVESLIAEVPRRAP